MRARNLKPSFFESDRVGSLPLMHRLLLEGLWCIADRMGRLEDRPLKIKGDIFRFDSFTEAEIDAALDNLSAKRFALRYQVGGNRYVWVRTFLTHNRPHENEATSIIPRHPEDTNPEALSTKDARAVNHGAKRTALNPPSPFPLPESPFPLHESGIRGEASGTKGDSATVAATAADTPDKIPPPPAAQGKTGKATTANVSATPAQLEMLAGLCTKRALRIPDVCQTLGIALPVPKADVDRIIAHIEAIQPVPPADRKRQRAADQAPVLWSDVSRMLDAGAVTDAHVALRAIVDPVLRRDVQRRLEAYLGERGDLLGAMLAVGSDHETLIRDLPVVWEALLSSKRYRAHDPPGTGVNEGDSRGVAL